MVNQTKNFSEEDYDAIMKMVVYTKSDRLTVGVITPIIVSIGIIGNIITILVLSKTPRMQTSVNVYLTSLAVADMLFLIMAPVISWQSLVNSDVIDMYDHPKTNAIFCKFNNFIIEVTYQMAYLMILCISVERYLAICRPLKYRTYGTRLRAIKICLAVWVVVLIYQSRILITMTWTVFHKFPWPDKYEGLPNVTMVCAFCLPIETTRCNVIYYLYYVDITIGLLVMLTLVPLYYLMVKKLRNSRFASVKKVERRRGSDVTVFRTVLLTVSVYAFCYIPFNIVNIVADPTKSVEVRTMYWFRVMMYVNAAVNPIIYNVTNAVYRQSFLEFFRCGRIFGSGMTTGFNCTATKRLTSSQSSKNSKQIKLTSIIKTNSSTNN
ncbi:somatostatin receptor type 4-like [Anneissia japonica]|uniref:somatostatin receptor type 4-like n=1 Tax=Anneissia japonica TaxID=1529436 RepID=UPI001425731E|nr:somatostatin receptor type 4-like [Anneissia japonica]